MIKKILRVFGVLICIGLLILSLVFTINTKIISSSYGKIIDDYAALSDYDCILVLGAGVTASGNPTPMLADRLSRGVELYDLGASDVLFMTGDSVKPEYDETTAMHAYALSHNVPEENITVDKYGIATYDSLYRAKHVFGYNKIIIVTQRYHMYRSLYLAESLGIDAVGVCAEDIRYTLQSLRDIRELLACVKAFGSATFKPLPAYAD